MNSDSHDVGTTGASTKHMDIYQRLASDTRYSILQNGSVWTLVPKGRPGKVLCDVWRRIDRLAKGRRVVSYERKQLQVARLVLVKSGGEVGKGQVVTVKDGNQENMRIGNLMVTTPQSIRSGKAAALCGKYNRDPNKWYNQAYLQAVVSAAKYGMSAVDMSNSLGMTEATAKGILEDQEHWKSLLRFTRGADRAANASNGQRSHRQRAAIDYGAETTGGYNWITGDIM